MDKLHSFLSDFWHGRLLWWEALLFVVVPVEVLLQVLMEVVNLDLLYAQSFITLPDGTKVIGWSALIGLITLLTVMMGASALMGVGLWRCAPNNPGWRGWTWLARLGVLYLAFPVIGMVTALLVYAGFLTYSGVQGYHIKRQHEQVLKELQQLDHEMNRMQLDYLATHPEGVSKTINISETMTISGTLQEFDKRDAELSEGIKESDALLQEMRRQLEDYKSAVRSGEGTSGTVVP